VRRNIGSHQVSLLICAFSGCSTLLKTISGETAGFVVDSESYVNYQGLFRWNVFVVNVADEI
jgi:hypothetical protein